ncbi:helix-turn-helix domain-containing protein [Xanthobacter flavus]|uniref:helix-turn-helix domain-containing protein n=1 Tax=Xanthobacter flavus TaxID=281 RepID=UPI00372D426A
MTADFHALDGRATALGHRHAIDSGGVHASASADGGTGRRGERDVRRIDPDSLYRQEQAAGYLGLVPGTLQKWRVHPPTSGPVLKFCKIGRAVRYRGSDILTFVEQSSCSSTSSTGV